MGFQSLVLNVLIASPSDLQEERIAARDAIHEWNDLHAEAEGVTLLPRMWETGATPETGVRPQASVNKQLVDNADLLIGMFWTKLGTSTGAAESGTVEEIDQTVAAGKTAMLYFSARQVDPGKIDLKQMKKLRAFKDETYQNALVGSFQSPETLKVVLSRDLTRRVRQMKQAIGAKPNQNVSGQATGTPNWRSLVRLDLKVSVSRKHIPSAQHVRALIVDLVNDGLELTNVYAVLSYPDKDGVVQRQNLTPVFDVPNPFRVGNSARFAIQWDDPSRTLPMATHPLSETNIEIYHGKLLATSIPATEWEDVLRGYAEADPELPPKPSDNEQNQSGSWMTDWRGRY